MKLQIQFTCCCDIVINCVNFFFVKLHFRMNGRCIEWFLFQEIEANWEIIRDEGLANMDIAKGAFVPEDENLREKGEWKQFTLFQRGKLDLQLNLDSFKKSHLID